ncbi:MAG: translation initiation factor IF-3, partial [Pseudomonadota bacterium]
MRRPHRAQAQKKEGPRANEEINVTEVQLIDAEGENHGVVSIDRAREIASDQGLDLVEISPNNNPPICKVLDFGKYKY